MKTIRLLINNQDYREKLISICANLGSRVHVEIIKKPSCTSDDYYVCFEVPEICIQENVSK